MPGVRYKAPSGSTALLGVALMPHSQHHPALHFTALSGTHKYRLSSSVNPISMKTSLKPPSKSAAHCHEASLTGSFPQVGNLGEEKENPLAPTQGLVSGQFKSSTSTSCLQTLVQGHVSSGQSSRDFLD